MTVCREERKIALKNATDQKLLQKILLNYLLLTSCRLAT